MALHPEKKTAMSRTRPVTYLSTEQLAKLSTQRLRAYKRRLKETGGGKEEEGEPLPWLQLLKLVDRILRERKEEAWNGLSWQERRKVILGLAELEEYEIPRAQSRAHKRDAERWQRGRL
jgi:hypothetical protein